MTQQEDVWRRATTLDRRVTELAWMAIEAVQVGGHDPEIIYQDANRYLQCLLGRQRGAQPRSRNEHPASYEAQFAAAVTAPLAGGTADEEWLRQDRVFVLCCGHLNDILHQEVLSP